MFGLMHFNGCQKTDDELYRRRLLYCGTCKAIGSEYGQSARMLLNNDVVFLAEILQAISTESTAKIEEWAPAFQSYNCLSLPDETEIPTTLRIAAAVSMILSELKLEDHIDDSGSLVFRSAKKCLDPAFTKSETEFARLAFPMDEIRKWFDQQSIVEQSGRGRVSELDSLSRFAEPTAMITAIVFNHSSSIVSGDMWTSTMYRLGHGFGSLIYLIDAFEDYARDFRSSAFNAIACAYDLKTAKIPDSIKARVERNMRQVLKELDQCIQELPLALEQKQEYSERLWRNVRRKTGFRLHKHSVKSQAVKIGETNVSRNSPSCNHSDNSLQSRWRTARTTASSLTSDLIPTCDSKLILSIKLTYRATIYLFVLLVAFLSPVQSRSIRTYRECVELPFNLMFWGAAIATIINSFIQTGNKSFAYAHAMVGGNGNNRPPHKEFRETTRLTEDSDDVEKQDEQGDEADDQKQEKRQKGVNNDQYRRSRAHASPQPVPICLCCDCSPCYGNGLCCDAGCDCCCEGSECCVGVDCCAGGECCGGGADCCAGGECCGGGGGCCGSIDCCAGGGDACAGGADCCGGCFS